MALLIDLQVLPGNLFEIVKARILANRAKRNDQQEQKALVRPRVQRRRFGANSTTYRRPEPAALRSESVVFGGVAIQADYFNWSGSEADWSVNLKIGSVNASQPTEFNYSYPVNDFYGPASPSGLPEDWQNLPSDVGSTIGYQSTSATERGAYGHSSRLLLDSLDHSGGSYAAARDLPHQSILSMPAFVVLPDGEGGAYVVFVLNRAALSKVYRITKTITTSLSLIMRQIVGGNYHESGPFAGPGWRKVVWDVDQSRVVGSIGNPNTAQTPLTPSQIAAAESTLPHLWTGSTRMEATIEIVKSVSITDYDIRLYKVTDKSVTQVTPPAKLEDWIRKIYPPVTLNDIETTTNLVPDNLWSVTDDADWGTGGAMASQTAWTGEWSFSNMPVVPQATLTERYQVGLQTESLQFSVWYDQPDAYSLSDRFNELFFLGAANTTNNVLGPSFAYAYDKDIRGFIPSQYNRSATIEFLNISPPTAYKGYDNSIQPKQWATDNGFELFYHTNWGSKALCRRGLALLGIVNP